jgi:hypothetical protein
MVATLPAADPSGESRATLHEEARLTNSAAKPLLTRLDVLVLALVAFIGLLNLPLPFTWDQALFTLGAKAISHGAVLYRDYWDTKQPGIFLFYLIGGRLFGFHEVGIHLFEMLWLLAFSVTLIITLRDYFESRALVSLVPLLAVGLYYAVADDAKMTQVEAIVGFPIYLTLWATLPRDEHAPPDPGRFLFSGFMGGIVLVFKLLFAPIVAAFWVAAFLDAWTRRRATFGQCLLRIKLPIALGMAIPLVLVVVYFKMHGAWDLAWWTWVRFPLRAVAETGAFRLSALVAGLSWFVFRFAPLMAVAFVGTIASLGGRRGLLTVQLVNWFVLSLVVILSQRTSWWPYQYLLLIAPVGVLAARGLDFLWGQAAPLKPQVGVKRLRTYGLIVLALLVGSAIGAQGLKTLMLARDRFALRPAQRLHFQSAIATQMPYTLVQDEVAFLHQPGSRPGPIYSIANPLFDLFADRETSSGQNAAILTRILIREEWQRIVDELRARPPAYIFIEKQLLPIMHEKPDRSAPFFELLDSSYSLWRHTDRGWWYVRADSTGSAR